MCTRDTRTQGICIRDTCTGIRVSEQRVPAIRLAGRIFWLVWTRIQLGWPRICSTLRAWSVDVGAMVTWLAWWAGPLAPIADNSEHLVSEGAGEFIRLAR